MSFEVNEGQTDKQVRFLSRGSGYNLFLTSTEAVLALSKNSRRAGKESIAEQLVGPQAMNPKQKAAEIKAGNSLSDVLRLRLVGANFTAQIRGADELPGKSNYFIGNTPAKWHRDISTYARVKYEGVYPGVDATAIKDSSNTISSSPGEFSRNLSFRTMRLFKEKSRSPSLSFSPMIVRTGDWQPFRQFQLVVNEKFDADTSGASVTQDRGQAWFARA